jgi:hypothetical protein
LLTAWAAAQLGLSVFFLLAYVLGRREAEYFVFSLLCLSLSLGSAGIAFDYASEGLAARVLADKITHTGVILAATVNLHFALCFSRWERRTSRLLPLYGLFNAFVER